MNKKLIKLYYPMWLIIPALISLSCDEVYNPKGEFKPAYVVNCMLKVSGTDGRFSYNANAYIAKAYDIDGNIPSGIDSSGFIPNAYVAISNYSSYMEMVAVKKQRFYSIAPGTDFTNNNFIPNTEADLKVVMPDRTVLTSRITLPKVTEYAMNRNLESGLRTSGAEWKFGRTLEFNWLDSYSADNLYFTSMVIYGEVISKKKSISIEVPIKYEKQGDKYIPLYPRGIKDWKVGYDYAAIDSAMKYISAGYEDKSDIRILNWTFSVTCYERNLSSFYSSGSGMDNFTIRLDRNTYSNINGGYGIFGAYLSVGNMYTVHKDYCKEFGYKTIFAD